MLSLLMHAVSLNYLYVCCFLDMSMMVKNKHFYAAKVMVPYNI